MRAFGRAMAVALLLCLPIAVGQAFWSVRGPNLVAAETARGMTVVAVRGGAARARVGDRVVMDGLSVGDRVRLISAPVFRGFAVPLERGGEPFSVPMAGVVRPVTSETIAFDVIAVGSAIGGLLLGAFVLWKRPSVVAVSFGAYALNFLYALPTVGLFSFLPDPAFSVVVVIGVTLVSAVPQLALVAFALRFPRRLEGPRGAAITRVFDGVLLALCALAAWRTAVVPTLYDVNDPWLDTAPSIFCTVALVVIVFARYARTRGEDRRRLGWIAVGAVASGVASTFNDLGIVGVVSPPQWVDNVAQVLQDALPVAFAYAILRHRVLDLGVAINRTVVYGTITATLVVAVGVIDWFGGKVLGNTHLSAFLEAAVTIALGVALSWFHGRVEHAVERLLFRRRYEAARRIESRIAALGFASKAGVVDDALVGEALGVLRLGSAAVFRRAEDAVFVRSASTGWDECVHELTVDHLLLRTLRAQERPVELDAAGIADAGFPAGAARAEIAIPIVVRHEFLGFAMYGRRHEDAHLDPEEREMLVRLVGAAAQAYDAIDAAEWRRRALALQALPSLEGAR